MKIRGTFLFLWWMFIVHLDMSAQCPIDITVPPDLTLCAPGSVDLIATATGNFEYGEWSGTNGFFDTDLVTSDIPTSNTTYTFTGYAPSDVNLVNNGDFELGNTGFTSSYLLAETNCIGSPWGVLGCEGMYTINTNAMNTHINFAPCTDHTSGSGNMMIVNGSPLGVNIWCQDIVVQPNTNYLFTAWACSVVSDSPAILQFSINGGLIGSNFNLTAATCQWENFTDLWNSGSSTNATICVTNQNFNIGGNDFALDDIKFIELCDKEESFDVTISEVLGSIPTSNSINCDNPTAIIDIEPSNPTYTYNWQANFGGTIEGDPSLSSITALSSGLYQVTITDENGCTKKLTTSVNGSTTPPDGAIVGNFELTCNNNEVNVFCTNTANGNTYNWVGATTTDNVPFATYNLGGNYYLEITNSFNCTSFIPFTISENIIVPQYNIPTPDILSCIGDSVELNFNSITFPDDLQWYDPNGNPLELGSTVTAKDIGYYVLEFGYSNGCTFTDSVQVFSQVSTLEYVLGESPLINCENPESEITALIISSYDEISWYHNGYLGNSQVLTVDEAGLYIIEISDINNCITRDSVYVESDFSLAPYTLESVDIDCFAGKGTLSVNSDSTIQVTWTHPSGQVVTSESFETTQAGTYYIEILNSNGCSELDSIELEANQDFPVISSAFDSLTCVKNTSTITVESNISNTQFEWTGPAGFNSTSDSLTVQQNGQYIYTATTENGCSVTDTITIYLDDEKPNFSLSADTINCFSPTATVLVQTTGDYTIAEVVSPDLIAIDNLAIEIGQAGLTTVIVIGDNGCETSESIQVIADLTKPESPIQEDIILNCFQTDTTLWIDVSDENDIFWIIGQQYVNFDDSFYIDSPGNIMIELQDKESGCTSSTEFNVDMDFSVPQMSLQASDINCQDTISTIYLSTQDNIYSLDFSSELNQINQTEFTTKASGTYSFVLQGDNGCTAEQSIIVSEDKIKPIIATTDQYLNCHNDPLNLSCSYDISNPEFIWVDPKGNETNNAILSTTSAGSYYITVTNPDNHCFETASLEVIPYKNNLAFEYTIEEALCYGETAILTDINIIAGNDPYELIVYNEFGQIANQNALGEGDYTLVFVDLDGCDSTTYFSIEEPVKIELDLDKELTLGIGTDLAIEAYTNLDPSEIEEINWTPDNYLSCNDCLNPVVSNLGEDTWFYVEIMDKNGCTQNDSILIRVVIDYTFYFPNIFTPNNDGNNDIFFPQSNIFGNESTIEIFQIYDRWGNNVFTKKDIKFNQPEEGWNGYYKGKIANQGVYAYFVKISLPDGTEKQFVGDVSLIR